MTRRHALQLVTAALASAELEPRAGWAAAVPESRAGWAAAVPESRAGWAAAAPEPRAGWEGYVTAAMAVDDVRRLLTFDKRVAMPLRRALLKNPQQARLGCGLPAPSSAIRATGGDAEQPLAVAAGALVSHTVMRSLERAGSAPRWIELDAALLAARNPTARPGRREEYAAYLRAMDIRC